MAATNRRGKLFCEERWVADVGYDISAHRPFGLLPKMLGMVELLNGQCDLMLLNVDRLILHTAEGKRYKLLPIAAHEAHRYQVTLLQLDPQERAITNGQTPANPFDLTQKMNEDFGF